MLQFLPDDLPRRPARRPAGAAARWPAAAKLGLARTTATLDAAQRPLSRIRVTDGRVFDTLVGDACFTHMLGCHRRRRCRWQPRP